MIRRLLAIILIALAAAVPLGASTKHPLINDTLSWLAMRSVTGRCLSAAENKVDPLISKGVTAYVQGYYTFPDLRWHPEDEAVFAWPVCRDFIDLSNMDVEGRSVVQLAWAVLAITHESGHLRDWNKKTLTSESEASTERWALRHVYAVSRRIGLDHVSSVLILRYAVKLHREELSYKYKHQTCKFPFVDVEGILRNCYIP